jgi:hypothetical protein
MDGADFDEAITYERAKTKRVKVRESFKHQASELILPLSVLKAGAGGFLDWMLQVTDTMPVGERTRKLSALKKINAGWIRPIDEYRFPVVTLSPEAGAGALCTIFETLNRTGVKLSVFELLTARFWPLKINLRERWAEALSKYPIIEDFEVDPYYILQAISLIIPNKAPSCKRGDVLELKPEDIERSWHAVIVGLATGLDILREDCKVVLSKWLPYQTMLAPLAAVLAKVGLPKTAAAGARRENLKRWFWCAVFGQAYESSPNSQSAKDVTELVAWLRGGALPDSVRTVRFDPKALRDVTPRQRSVYRGAICLILASGTGARDFHTGKIITSKLIKEEDIDDHHVFPSQFLEVKKVIKTSQLRDCILNRTLIDRNTNHMISNHAPSDYFKAIRKTPSFPFEKVLESHFLPSDKKSPLWTDDYETYLTWREKRLWDEIKRVTGMEEATVL